MSIVKGHVRRERQIRTLKIVRKTRRQHMEGERQTGREMPLMRGTQRQKRQLLYLRLFRRERQKMNRRRMPTHKEEGRDREMLKIGRETSAKD